MSKSNKRKQMIELLSNFEADYKLSQENILKDKLMNFIEEHSIRSIGIVLSMDHELNTNPIINTLIENGIRVYGPKCNYRTKAMNFYEIKDLDEISKDEKSIRVPSDNNDLNNYLDCIVVPGLVFNADGYRIGYGGGFYDRFLKSFNGKTVSIIFDEQMGKVEPESHDIPVQKILTPTKTIDVSIEV